ncbi:hypothetical protein D9756_002538 [Leucocoprinus leucothites]|uniref:F-box domain-containing protein n=1 Tax=Leucocoprinus leucothites TaxID=201217 RepID=A0A8H5GBA6_9AGAR|nr:hypothetical protein D9756_002538 [Leucoagaricus leucothites]
MDVVPALPVTQEPTPPSTLILPHEIICTIIHACGDDLSLLHAWSLVSPACFAEVQPYLYRELVFTGQSPLDITSQGGGRCLGWSRTYLFLDSTRHKPELLRFVRHLTIELKQGVWPATMWAAFLKVFPSMTGLKHFRLDITYSTYPHVVSLEALFPSSSMKLKELSLSIPDMLSAYFHDLPQILQHQQELEELDLIGCHWEVPAISMDACPNLHTISTWSLRCIEVMVPGRPVVKLCWDLSQPHLHRLSYENLADSRFACQALSQIRILVLRGPHASDRLAVIAPYLLLVEVLDLEDSNICAA